jgi:hypothetical protein
MSTVLTNVSVVLGLALLVCLSGWLVGWAGFRLGGGAQASQPGENAENAAMLRVDRRFALIFRWGTIASASGLLVCGVVAAAQTML